VQEPVSHASQWGSEFFVYWVVESVATRKCITNQIELYWGCRAHAKRFALNPERVRICAFDVDHLLAAEAGGSHMRPTLSGVRN